MFGNFYISIIMVVLVICHVVKLINSLSIIIIFFRAIEPKTNTHAPMTSRIALTNSAIKDE